MNKKEFSKSNIKSLIQIAVQKHQSGELDEAESLYKQILQIHPECIDKQEDLEKEYRPIIIGNLANIFEQKGKLDAAIEHYQQTLQLKPDYAEAYYNLGNVFRQQGKLEAAVESYQQAIKIKPEIAQAYDNLANVFRQQG
ncbi:tetratricopeptide repeat protein, partial [Dapis sp. BLCC M172]|uniref:tetratricopeptide repeat protein n=1 Tax=Dapis sp. BLCC M172 TaxID=2975281 RepID=UPI003CE8CE98